MRPFILAESNWADVRATAYDTAILPWGATEAHNYHLPYGTDVYQAEHIAAEAASIAWGRGAKAVVLPAVPFGVNTGQMDIKLDLNMNPSTQYLVLQDLVDSVARAGVKKFVVLNGHGGNDFRQMIRELQACNDAIFICVANWYQILDNAAFFETPGDHAGEMETSLMMHLRPDLVGPLSAAGSGAAREFAIEAIREGWVWAQREWSKITEDTGVGDPSASTPEKGTRFFAAVTEKIADFLVELSACPLDKLYR